MSKTLSLPDSFILFLIENGLPFRLSAPLCVKFITHFLLQPARAYKQPQP